MNKRVFMLFTICIIALGLVSLALMVASAHSPDVPAGVKVLPPVTHPAYQVPKNYPPPGNGPSNSWMSVNNQRAVAEKPAHGASPVDQMRQQAMVASPSPELGLDQVEFWLNQSSMSNMWGHADPGAAIIITTPREEFNASADPNGDWGTGSLELYPGDKITVIASPGYSATVTIPAPIEAHANSALGEAWGEVGGWFNREIEVHRNWDNNPLVVQTDGAGAFVAMDETMPPGAAGYIRFLEDIGTTQVIYHRPYIDIVPTIRVNYAHDWVEADYEPGYTVWLTLTNATGELKATASGETGMVPWWGGSTGFSTNDKVLWSTGQNPDIQAGDWVYASYESGYTSQVQLGVIEGALDVSADTISGNIYAAWFTQTLSGGCGVWVQDGPGAGFDVDPNGGSYACDFGAQGWNVIPGEDVGVNYWEPDGDQVINVFRGPAPHLWIQTWGQGEAAAGGNYVLNVQYNNDGDAPAAGVTITATLLDGMSYLGDTSGFTPTGTGQPGDPLVWQIGVLPVSLISAHGFEVFVQVTAGVGGLIDHEVNIETTTAYFQGDPENKSSYWSGAVVDNNTDVNVGGNALTGDPVPGSEFVYRISVCTGGSTASTEVTLTDTLPLSTTLVSWDMQRLGWVEVSSSAHQLVLARPSAPSGWCGDVYVRVHLDAGAWEGMLLENNAFVSAANDLDPGNNSVTIQNNVGGPHTNLAIWKDWDWGNFVPGGQVYFEFRYENSGNLPAQNVFVTSTLPEGTSFLFAYTPGDWGWIPITPTTITPETLVWDVGQMDNGAWQNLGIALQIDPQAQPGSLLNLTVEISPQPMEDRYTDNSSTWIERVNEPGPNLSVDKHTNWRWNWDGQLEFELRIRNLGSQTLDNFWITDTYPISMVLSDWWQNHGPWITYTHDAQNRQIGMWVDGLNPNETASVSYRLDLDPEIIGVEGLAFTNTLQAPIAGDTNLADNADTVIAYSGPDIFIENKVSAGELRAGEIVTFTVEFGNQNMWPWDGEKGYPSYITETLPAEMTFLKATKPGDPDSPWYPMLLPGNRFLWEWGEMGNRSNWSFEIVAQIDADVVGGDVLSNRIEAYGSSPNDRDPNWENNVNQLDLTIVEAPQAAFVSNSPVRFGQSLVFTNTSFPGYPPAQYTWDFGDGETSVVENPAHLYAAPGVYTITLTAANEVISSTFIQDVEVLQPWLYLPIIIDR